eukprot:GHUV01022376.1.p1 GENE.GHUV01022376.1~~GHUV01022376.1.p1  ORF type:complete len:101 (+),score=16.35 GHUV01022376.1:542-844(+)
MEEQEELLRRYFRPDQVSVDVSGYLGLYMSCFCVGGWCVDRSDLASCMRCRAWSWRLAYQGCLTVSGVVSGVGWHGPCCFNGIGGLTVVLLLWFCALGLM